MPTGWSETTAQAILNAARGGTPFSLAAHWVQLHSGDPGADGTANVTNGGAREIVTFAAAAGNEMVSNVEVAWTDWDGGFPTHFTAWPTSADGTFHLSGLVNIGDGSEPPAPGVTATIPAGSLIYRQLAATSV